MPLIVCSESTECFAKKMEGDIMKVAGLPTERLLKYVTDEETVIAIGGGSVIDTAKIIAMNTKSRKVIAIPTTASGAAKTSHAIYWKDGRKYSVKTPKPEVKIIPGYLRTLPDDVVRATSYDALGQALESLWSKRATVASKAFAREAIKALCTQITLGYLDFEELIRCGNLSGQAIEITGTNIAHAISYPLTGFYGIPHGFAVGLILPAVTKYVGDETVIPKYEIDVNENFNFPFIADEAMGYVQIHDAAKNITRNGVLDILREAL